METIFLEILKALVQGTAHGTAQGAGQELSKSIINQKVKNGSYKNNTPESRSNKDASSSESLIQEINNILEYSRIGVDNKIYIKKDTIYFTDGKVKKSKINDNIIHKTKINKLINKSVNAIYVSIFCITIMIGYIAKDPGLGVLAFFILFIFSFFVLFDDNEIIYEKRHEFNVSINLISGELTDKNKNTFSLKNLIEVTREKNRNVIMLISNKDESTEKKITLAQYENNYEFVTFNFLISHIQSNLEHKFIPK